MTCGCRYFCAAVSLLQPGDEGLRQRQVSVHELHHISAVHSGEYGRGTWPDFMSPPPPPPTSFTPCGKDGQKGSRVREKRVCVCGKERERFGVLRPVNQYCYIEGRGWGWGGEAAESEQERFEGKKEGREAGREDIMVGDGVQERKKTGRETEKEGEKERSKETG